MPAKTHPDSLGVWAFHMNPGTRDAKKGRGTGAAGSIAFQSNRQGDKGKGDKGKADCGLWIAECGFNF